MQILQIRGASISTTYKINFEVTLKLAIVYFSSGDKTSAKLYMDKARQLEPLLAWGMEGITDLEKKGMVVSDNEKETLKKMFEELK